MALRTNKPRKSSGKEVKSSSKKFNGSFRSESKKTDYNRRKEAGRELYSNNHSEKKEKRSWDDSKAKNESYSGIKSKSKGAFLKNENSSKTSSYERKKNHRGGDGERSFREKFSSDFGNEKKYFSSGEKDYRKSEGGERTFRKKFSSESGNEKRFDSPDKKSYRKRDESERPFRKKFSSDSENKKIFPSSDEKGYRNREGQERPYRKKFSSDSEKERNHSSFDKKDYRNSEDEEKPYRKKYSSDNEAFKKSSAFEKKTFSKKYSDSRSRTYEKSSESSYRKRPDKYKNSFEKKPRKKFGFREEEKMQDDGRIRLNKYLSNAGVGSRREADVLIQTGAVKVNGKVVAELGSKIYPGDKVEFGGERVKTETLRYVLINKPKDYITTAEDPQERRTVMDLVREACRERIYPVGRLDRNTTGVLLLTNDGTLTKKLTHPKYQIKKIYHVELDKNVKVEELQQIAEGIELEDGIIKADTVSYVQGAGKNEVGIEIHSGRNRIVRRMFEHLGHTVIKLDRVSFAGLTKKNLPRGKWRFLTEMEVNILKML